MTVGTSAMSCSTTTRSSVPPGSRTRLNQTEQIKKFGQTNTVGVARILDVDVEVAAYDEKAAKQQTDGFEQCRQVVEKRRRRSHRTGTVDGDDDERRAFDSQSYPQALERRNRRQ